MRKHFISVWAFFLSGFVWRMNYSVVLCVVQGAPETWYNYIVFHVTLAPSKGFCVTWMYSMEPMLIKTLTIYSAPLWACYLKDSPSPNQKTEFIFVKVSYCIPLFFYLKKHICCKLISQLHYNSCYQMQVEERMDVNAFYDLYNWFVSVRDMLV